MATRSGTMKPITLYDHLPGILAGYPAALFAVLALLSLPQEYVGKNSGSEIRSAESSTESSTGTAKAADTERVATSPWWVPNPHMLFWIGMSIMIVWYVAFQFNMPKSKFWLMFGLLGTFIGIPVVLEISGFIKPFSTFAHWLDYLAPQANAGAYFVLSLAFFVIWLGNFVWSRTHMKVVIDESGLTVNRLGGKGQRFDLIGLKTENEPLDYLELFLAGVGSLALKSRMNKPIFEMTRVVGLYRTPLFPFIKGKLSRIEEMLSRQGHGVSIGALEAADMAEQMDSDTDGLGEESEYYGDSGRDDAKSNEIR